MDAIEPSNFSQDAMGPLRTLSNTFLTRNMCLSERKASSFGQIAKVMFGIMVQDLEERLWDPPPFKKVQ